MEELRRRREVDPGVARPCPVVKGRTRIGTLGHGAVDRQAGRLAHFREKRVLHGFPARRQQKFEAGAVQDVGADGPDAAMNGLDRGQADGHGQPGEVEVGLDVAAAAVPVDAEDEAVPALGMDGAVEEGLAFKRLAFERDRQRVVARCTGDRGADHFRGYRGLELHGGAGWIGRAVVVPDLGVAPAHEVFRLEIHGPALPDVAVRRARPRGDPAAAVREAENPHAGGVLAGHQVVAPAVLAEAQQDRGVLDACAVVGNGHRQGFFGRIGRAVVGLAVVCGDGDADAGGAGPAGVLKSLREDVVESGCEEPRDALERAVVDPGADGRGGRIGGVCHVGSP